MTNAIDLRTKFQGRYVYVATEKWLDYFPRGCALKLVRRDGRTQYAQGQDPNEALTFRVTNA